METTKVIIVDDQPAYRNVLKTVLHKSGNVDIIAEASNGKEFLGLLRTHQPDVIFMDIEMPEMNGIEATREALEYYPELSIIGLSMYDNENYIKELISAGARGYLLKLSDNYKIFETILKFPKAEIFFSKEIEYHRPETATSKGKKSVLIVDDFKNTRFIVKHVLENAGYSTLEAENGKNALEVMQGVEIDLLVTDYNMPIMNGWKLIQEVKKKPEYRTLPILVLTTETSDEKRKKGQEVGITGWIVKPFDTKRFLKIVQKALS